MFHLRRSVLKVRCHIFEALQVTSEVDHVFSRDPVGQNDRNGSGLAPPERTTYHEFLPHHPTCLAAAQRVAILQH